MPTEQQFENTTRSTLLSRLRARLQVNSVSKFIAWSKEAPRGFSVFQVNRVSKSHYLSLFLGSSIMLVGCYSGVLVTMARN